MDVSGKDLKKNYYQIYQIIITANLNHFVVKTQKKHMI